jgi:hypothetical protein
LSRCGIRRVYLFTFRGLVILGKYIQYAGNILGAMGKDPAIPNSTIRDIPGYETVP